MKTASKLSKVFIKPDPCSEDAFKYFTNTVVNDSDLFYQTIPVVDEKDVWTKEWDIDVDLLSDFYEYKKATKKK